MKAINELRKRRAVSPVIATVIIVAVTITVAVAVSYWMSGIASQYTSFEKVEIKSAYASRKYGGTSGTTFMGWVIKIGVQNTGSSTSTLESLYVNNKPLSEYGSYGDPASPTGNKIRWTDAPPTGTEDELRLWATWAGTGGITDVVSVSLESGDERTIYILIFGDKSTPSYDPTPGDPNSGDEVYEGLFSAGTTTNIQFHSAAGMDYIKLVQLS